MAFLVDRQPRVGQLPVTDTTSTGTAIAAYGLATIAGATAAKTWTAPVPVQGRVVHLLCLDGATGAVQTVTKTGVEFLSTAGAKATISFNHDYESCTLVGRNSSQWYVFGQSALASS